MGDKGTATPTHDTRKKWHELVDAINNARTSSVLGGVKEMLSSHVDVTYAPGCSIADTNLSAPYFTTVQRHSFAKGLTGSYWPSRAARASDLTLDR